ncbi:unnamed protein product [Meganyctiphanes norvegica]|uniref:HAT C-terminal dimerisation domain-containing protein n=1 Tax=Meganyctiphanes norvegica TaxID=48144 RepID=A0AAV2R9H0_MEGNR
MPPVSKLSSREIDALSIEWKLLVLEDLPFCTEENKKKTKSISNYWRVIFYLKDIGDNKYPVIEKVVKFALSIAEANASVERLFSQLFHIITKDRNKLETHTVKGLLITNSYLQANGTCTNLKIDETMMYHIKASHSKYCERNLERKDYRREDSLEKKIARRS